MAECSLCGNQLPRANLVYCSKECTYRAKYHYKVEAWLKGELRGNVGVRTFKIANFVRRYMHEINGGSCQMCGFSERHPSGASILQVHHRDGDIQNTVIENLELLCPNCHALTDTYCARNKGSKRDWR